MNFLNNSTKRITLRTFGGQVDQYIEQKNFIQIQRVSFKTNFVMDKSFSENYK